MLNFPFSAAVLAGGQSRRMGRDKASLIVDGTVLWERQIRLLAELNPRQLFICGRPEGAYIDKGYEVVIDVVPDAGPLGGLITALRHASTDMLLLLAVDLPAMQASFLKKLLDRAHASSRSVIPSTGEQFEPLAAVYRTDSLEKAEEQLRAGEHAMKKFAADLVSSRMAEVYPIASTKTSLFLNVNTPTDLARFQARNVGAIDDGGR